MDAALSLIVFSGTLISPVLLFSYYCMSLENF